MPMKRMKKAAAEPAMKAMKRMKAAMKAKAKAMKKWNVFRVARSV